MSPAYSDSVLPAVREIPAQILLVDEPPWLKVDVMEVFGEGELQHKWSPHPMPDLVERLWPELQPQALNVHTTQGVDKVPLVLGEADIKDGDACLGEEVLHRVDELDGGGVGGVGARSHEGEVVI